MAASIESVAAAYGFSMRQQRLIAALIDSGSLRLAAAEHRLPYASARNTLAEVKAKTGIATVPQLIGHFLDLLHAGGSSRRHDLFDLSERQYAIAASLSVAKSRADIARQLGVSDAVIDGEIKTIYLILGVRSAGEVARVFAAAMRDEPDIGSEHELPERTVTLGERRVALSDFGPSNGRPVFILHSTITARTPPSRLVAALHAAGYRPLALDRPGFGGTDMARDGDPFAAAAIDLAGVCATLGLDRVALVARGSGQAAVRTTALFPHLIDHAVLVNPTPAVAFTTVDRGPLGAVKRHFARRPFAIEAMIRALGGFATPRRMESGMLRAFASSAPDLRWCATTRSSLPTICVRSGDLPRDGSRVTSPSRSPGRVAMIPPHFRG